MVLHSGAVNQYKNTTTRRVQIKTVDCVKMIATATNTQLSPYTIDLSVWPTEAVYWPLPGEEWLIVNPSSNSTTWVLHRRLSTQNLGLVGPSGWSSKPGDWVLYNPNGRILIESTSVLVQTDTWHAVPQASISGNWTVTGATNPVRVKKNPDNTVTIDGELITTGTATANTTIFSLSTLLNSSYAPAQTHYFTTRSDIAVAAGQCTINVLSSGAVQNGQAFTASSQRLWFDGVRFPLD